MIKDVQFWNDHYESLSEYDPSAELDCKELEEALTWVSQGGGTILDIGSGDGRMILRTLYKGAVKIIGLDSSFHGISLARRSAQAHFSSLRTKWLWGNLGSLATLPDGCVSGIIISGLLEALTEEETEYVLERCERLLDQGGRLMVLSDESDDLTRLSSLFALQSEISISFEKAYGVDGDCRTLKLMRFESIRRD